MDFKQARPPTKNTILVVEDEEVQYQRHFVSKLHKALPDKNIVAVETLRDAEMLLQNDEYNFVAVLTDGDFPPCRMNDPSLTQEDLLAYASEDQVRLRGRKLIDALRSGEFGEKYKDFPIFFASGKMNKTIEEGVQQNGSYTQCYHKETKGLSERIADDMSGFLEGRISDSVPFEKILEAAEEPEEVAPDEPDTTVESASLIDRIRNWGRGGRGGAE